jgi:DNA repair protein RadC
MARLTDAVQQELIKGFVDSATLNAASRGIGALISSSFIDRALTTNFDHLIMKACVGLNVWPGVYDYASSGVFVEERLHDKAIIHLHGKHDGIVLINTPERFRQHGTKIVPIIKECQKGRIWIVVGYSGENDPVFEQLCAVDKYPFGLYWICHGEEDPASRVVERLLGESRNAYLIRNYDADNFFTLLTQYLGIDAGNKISPEDTSTNNIKDRLCERIIERDAGSLDSAEILEFLLSFSPEPVELKSLAALLLLEFGSLGGVLSADPNRLQETIRAINRRETEEGRRSIRLTVGHLKAIKESVGRILREPIEGRPVISSWSALLDYLQVALTHEPIEQFRVLFLDRKNMLIKDEVQQRGTVDHTALYPREIVKRALELAASAIIMVHNHPSGDPTPTRGDIEMTKQVVAALAAVGITVHDHVIVGKNGHTSFKTQRLL